MDKQSHWENVYRGKEADNVSWFQEHAETSLKIITRLQTDKSAHILDVGGGASTLVDDLIDSGYEVLSVLDISTGALEVAQQRLGDDADKVQWITQDVTQLQLPEESLDVWHDRAVFHFLTNEQDRQNYVDVVKRTVKHGGHVIVSTFAEDGPEKCSGLEVQRYNKDSLHSEFGSPFTLLGHENEIHQTPSGQLQHFVYCYCRLN